MSGLFKWLFRKKDDPAPEGVIINPPIDPNNMLDRYEITLKAECPDVILFLCKAKEVDAHISALIHSMHTPIDHPNDSKNK